MKTACPVPVCISVSVYSRIRWNKERGGVGVLRLDISEEMG